MLKTKREKNGRINQRRHNRIHRRNSDKNGLPTNHNNTNTTIKKLKNETNHPKMANKNSHKRTKRHNRQKPTKRATRRTTRYSTNTRSKSKTRMRKRHLRNTLPSTKNIHKNIKLNKMPEQSFGEQLGMQTASQAANNIMGIIMGGFNDQRQLEQQGRLNEQSKKMIDYNYAKQLQMWKDTGPTGMVKQLELAGLNKGLMYGMTGAGGGTTGSGGHATPEAPKGGGEIIAAQQMGIQYQLLQAQKENIEADTKLKETDAAKTAGVDTEEAKTRIASLTQGIENAKQQQILTQIQQRLQKLDLFVKGETLETTIDRIKWEAQKIGRELDILKNEAYISNATMTDKINIIQREAIGATLRNALTKAQTAAAKSGIAVNNAEINKMAQEIQQKWAEQAIHWRGLDQKAQEIAIQKMIAEYTTTHPGLQQVAGNVLSESIKALQKSIPLPAAE